MAWKTETVFGLSQINAVFPEGLESDYIDPVLSRSLVEHLKSYWLIRALHDYSTGYEAAKVREILEPEKFTEKDWLCIATVCGFGKSWAYRQMENI